MLYIGKAGAGKEAEPFGSRFNEHPQHHIVEEYCTKGGRIEEIRIRIGRVHCEKYTGARYWTWPDDDWIPLVCDAEALLINHHFDRLKNKVRPKCNQALSIQNTGDYGSLDETVT